MHGLTIQVSDTGKGIPRNKRDVIFKKYHTTSKKGSNVGLGLSFVQRVVKENEGMIDVDSEVGVGTTFTVWLPTSQGEKEAIMTSKRKDYYRTTKET